MSQNFYRNLNNLDPCKTIIDLNPLYLTVGDLYSSLPLIFPGEGNFFWGKIYWVLALNMLEDYQVLQETN